MDRSFLQRIEDFGLTLGGDTAGLARVREQRMLGDELERKRAAQKQVRSGQLSEGRVKAAAQDFRDIGLALESGLPDEARKRVEDRLRVGSLLPDFNPESTNYLKTLLDGGNIDEAKKFLSFADQAAVSRGVLEPRPSNLVNPNMVTDTGQMLRSSPDGGIVAEDVTGFVQKPESGVNSQISGTVQGKDEAGNLFNIATVFNPATGTTERSLTPIGEAQNPVGQVEMVDSSGRTRLERISEAGLEAGQRAAAEAAIKASTSAFGQLEGIKGSVSLLRDVAKAIDDGADSGPFISKLPSIREASIKLDNLQNQLGLNVIQNTTFGALSKAEMDMALQTALPTGLDEPSLKQWSLDKAAAQEKMADYLAESAIYLGTPGNNIKGWLEYQKQRQILESSRNEPKSNKVMRFDSQGNLIQ